MHEEKTHHRDGGHPLAHVREEVTRSLQTHAHMGGNAPGHPELQAHGNDHAHSQFAGKPREDRIGYRDLGDCALDLLLGGFAEGIQEGIERLEEISAEVFVAADRAQSIEVFHEPLLRLRAETRGVSALEFGSEGVFHFGSVLVVHAGPLRGVSLTGQLPEAFPSPSSAST